MLNGDGDQRPPGFFAVLSRPLDAKDIGLHRVAGYLNGHVADVGADGSLAILDGDRCVIALHPPRSWTILVTRSDSAL